MRFSQVLVRKENNFDLLRLVLACMVIVGHSALLNAVRDGFHDPVRFLFPLEQIHTVAVKVFLFISGLVVTNSLMESRSGRHFLISRAFRILPNLVFLLLVSVLVIGPLLTTLPWDAYFRDPQTWAYLGNNALFHTEYTLPGVFLDNHFPADVNGSLWTLNTEVGCYLVTLALFLLAVRFGQEKAVLTLVALVVILDTGFNNHSLFPWMADRPQAYLLPSVFALGALFALHKDRIRFDWTVPTAMATLALVLRQSPAFHEVAVFAICLTAVYLFSRPWLNRLRLPFDISYGVYLWGFLVQQLVVHLTGPVNVFVHMGLSLVLTLLVATLSHLLIERPFINLGRKLLNRGETSR